MDLEFYARVRTCEKRVTGKQPSGKVKTLLKSLLSHPQRTLDLEYQYGGNDFKILFSNA